MLLVQNKSLELNIKSRNKPENENIEELRIFQTHEERLDY